MSSRDQQWEIFYLVIDQHARFEPVPLTDPQPIIVSGGDCQAVIAERNIEGAYILPYSHGLGHDIEQDPRLLTELFKRNALWLRKSDLGHLIDYLAYCYADGGASDPRQRWGDNPDLDELLTILREQMSRERFLDDNLL